VDFGASPREDGPPWEGSGSDFGVLAFLTRRVAYAAATVFATAWFAYGMIRLLRPDMSPGEGLLSGTWHDVDASLLHLTLGREDIHQAWVDGIFPDLYLLAGGVIVAVVLGVSGGIWCAARPRTRASRALEAVAMFFLCTPSYVIALGLLLLFAPPFGLVQLPFFFEPHTYAPPSQNPWTFFRSMLVPWIAVGLPLAASILRLTLTLTIDNLGEPFVQTARAKGLPNADVVRRHAAPTSLVTVASLFGASAPIMVTNMVLVESVFSVPGFFRLMRRALGQNPGGTGDIDIRMLQGIALWASVLIVAVSFLGDLAIARLDPRLRASGRLG
jgi:peptide/nickel transport system permease protein